MKHALTSVAAAALVLMAAAAQAGPAKGPWAFGKPGKEADVTRTVQVVADDRGKMRYELDLQQIVRGETIKFVVTNRGTATHEFGVGDTASQRAHAKLMAKNPDMKHADDPTVVTVEPGQTKELIWTFNKQVRGDIVFACHLPGHYEAGMVHEVDLAKKPAANS